MDKRFDFASCFTLTNLMKAARICYKGVGWKNQPQRFMNNLLTNCRKLQIELEEKTYIPRKVKRFTICERGKLRIIKPVNFRDRVVQRCLCNNVITPLIKENITADNSSCLKGRGLSYAFDRVKSHIDSAPIDGWYVQYDLHDYFHSIDRSILLNKLESIIDDKDLMHVVRVIINADAGGLELGSHVSQLCATFYPDSMDRAIQSVPGVIGYHRYMDDGLIVCKDKKSADNAKRELLHQCELLHLEINEKKYYSNKITHPIVFCKMRFRKTENGVKMNVRKPQTHRSLRHAKKAINMIKSNPEVDIDIIPVIASFNGYVNRGDANLSWLVKRIDNETI